MHPIGLFLKKFCPSPLESFSNKVKQRSVMRTARSTKQARCMQYKGVFKGGGFRGFKPPPKFSDFFFKSEGKEIESKRKKGMLGGGGGYLLTYFWG